MSRLVLASALAAAYASDIHPPNVRMLWQHFKKDYERDYKSAQEEEYRFKVFAENIEKIYASNAKNKSYTLGVTKNADRTFEEWKTEYLTGFVPTLTAERKNRPVFTAPPGFAVPKSIDWVKKGGVTSVKNQGTCGSCWTFSTVGALEGAMFTTWGKTEDLSMQRLLACDDGGNGCKGGSMDQAFAWVQGNGLPSLKTEPYLCKDGMSEQCTNMQCGICNRRTGETCIFGGCTHINGTVCDDKGLLKHCLCPENTCYSGTDATNGKCTAAKPEKMVIAVGDVTGHVDVGIDDTGDHLEAAVAQQPVSVAIEADQVVFQHYHSGILTDDACGSQLDHGVLAVGYGVDNGQKYWKVKNSWGEVFGEDGYIRIARGSTEAGGECGIRKMASFPQLKKKQTEVVV